MKPGQELSNAIGNAVGEHKRCLLNRIKAGADLETAMAQFFAELSLAFDRIVAVVKATASKGASS